MTFNFRFIGGIIFCTFCASSRFSQGNATKSLKLVQIISRHGETNRGWTYPNDPQKGDPYWNGGEGQLIDVGKRRMYEMGIYFREKYDTLIGKMYSPESVYMLSSDYDKTIRSALAFLAGLYKESNFNSTWYPDIKWDPIPVHTVAKELDRIFEVTESCPKLDKIKFDTINNSEFSRNFIETNIDDLVLYSEKAGRDFIHDLNLFLKLILDLTEQHQVNLELPSWVNSLLESHKSLPMYFQNLLAHRDSWLRLRIGTLFSDIVRNMEEASKDGAVEIVPMRLWSSHDRVMAEVVQALKLYHLKEFPPCGSAIIFELHKMENADAIMEYFVAVYNRNTTSNDNPVLMEIPECPSPCSLDGFKTVTKKFIPDDWKAECELDVKIQKTKGAKPSSSSGIIYGALILLTAVITCSIFIGFTCHKKGKITIKYQTI